MGLDNYWQKSDGAPASVEGKFNICGGMLSGNGNNSFRGKIYNSVVESLTGISLYEDVIDNDNCIYIGNILRNAKYSEAKKYSEYDLSEEEFNDFVEMWLSHSMNGHRLVSWY